MTPSLDLITHEIQTSVPWRSDEVKVALKTAVKLSIASQNLYFSPTSSLQKKYEQMLASQFVFTKNGAGSIVTQASKTQFPAPQHGKMLKGFESNLLHRRRRGGGRTLGYRILKVLRMGRLEYRFCRIIKGIL